MSFVQTGAPWVQTSWDQELPSDLEAGCGALQGHSQAALLSPAPPFRSCTGFAAILSDSAAASVWTNPGRASSRSPAGGVSWPWVGPVGTGLVHVYTDEWEILRGAGQPGARFLLHLGCCPESLGFVTE